MSAPEPASPDTRTLVLPRPLPLDCGLSLGDVRIAYRTWGRPTDAAVVVCHALTGSADVDRWWPDLLGPGRALDPDRDFVVSSNVLGSCYGTTGPADDPGDGGGRWGATFPRITVRDMVRAQRRLLDALGVRRVELVLGGSLGGMQALEWAATDPRVETAAVLAAPARHSPWAIALNEAQRAAIAADPRWCGGAYSPDRPPTRGLAAARMLAMCSYRSPEGLAARFDRELAGAEPRVVDWLRHHGRALVERFDAGSYVALTRAMDTHDVGRDRGGVATALAAIRVPVLVVAVDSDLLYPAAEVAELAAALAEGELETLRSPHGHDAFLIEGAEVAEKVRRFRDRRAARPVRLAS